MSDAMEVDRQRVRAYEQPGGARGNADAPSSFEKSACICEARNSATNVSPTVRSLQDDLSVDRGWHRTVARSPSCNSLDMLRAVWSNAIRKKLGAEGPGQPTQKSRRDKESRHSGGAKNTPATKRKKTNR